jgi:hypothetical protein
MVMMTTRLAVTTMITRMPRTAHRVPLLLTAVPMAMTITVITAVRHTSRLGS